MTVDVDTMMCFEVSCPYVRERASERERERERRERECVCVCLAPHPSPHLPSPVPQNTPLPQEHTWMPGCKY